MAVASYRGIVFPDRAESVRDFPSYRVFLDHWNELSTALGERFEGVALRGESRVLAVHGEQGRGRRFSHNSLQKISRQQRLLSNPRQPIFSLRRAIFGTDRKSVV